MLESVITGAEGFVKIKDVTDKNNAILLRDEKNAVHFGNLSASIAKALSWENNGHLKYMAFGNNGTTIDSSGVIVYKETNTSLIFDPNSSLYRTTFIKEILENDVNTSIDYELSTNNYADIVTTVILNENEPSGQNSIDNDDGTGDFVFDEIGIWSGPSGNLNENSNDFVTSSDMLMLTHVIFHPVEKSQNRIIEIEYTLRIQMGTL